MYNFYFLFIIALLFIGVSLPVVSAAVIKIEHDSGVLQVDDLFTVEVVIDTEGETLNTVAATVVFPDDLIEFVATDDSESVVSMWIETPNYHDDRIISFAGIVPGGFRQSATPILKLNFKVLDVGQADIQIGEVTLLRHDGIGTVVTTTKENRHISSIRGTGDNMLVTADDEIPEHFVPEIFFDPDVFAGNATLVFSTKDKGSGLDHFEVREGWFGRYQIAVSPYQIKYPKRTGTIFVKAIDAMGNERVEVLYPQGRMPWYKHDVARSTILVLCLGILLGMYKWLLPKLRR